jgi:predicted nucleic acid-binding protein
MRYLIDTCVFSEYAKLHRNTAVTDWVESQAQESVYISVLTVGEIERGIIRMPPSRRKTALGVFLEDLIKRFDDHVLNLTTATMRRWAKTVSSLEKRGRNLPVIDSLIAATALEYDLTVVTRNEVDFEPTGVKVLNLWRS